ncbi:hypothetical protein C8R45DRAFT_1204310 [Mycena sanguinolenta]|nr:hypothetical protein C8R45DRAFT_1204310 [Mycena sanguinolenta]
MSASPPTTKRPLLLPGIAPHLFQSRSPIRAATKMDTTETKHSSVDSAPSNILDDEKQNLKDIIRTQDKEINRLQSALDDALRQLKAIIRMRDAMTANFGALEKFMEKMRKDEDKDNEENE